MKPKLLLSLLLLFQLSAFAQPSIQWQKSLGGTDIDQANAIQQTADGGYIVAGVSHSNNGNVSGNHDTTGTYGDYWIVKLSGSGSIQWQKCLGGTQGDDAYSIQQTTDGGYIVAGASTSNDGDVSGLHSGSTDYWVVKLSSSGSIQWQKCLGGANVELASFVQQTIDGGYIVAGWSDSNDGDVTGNHGGNGDYWIVKLDSISGIQWQKCLGGTNQDIATCIRQTSDGGYIVAGYSSSNDDDVSGNHDTTGTYSDCWIVKLTGNGAIQWKKCLGGTNADGANSIQQTADGGYVIAGYSSSNDGDVSGNHGSSDYWIIKADSSGAIQWQKCYGGTGADYANSIQQTIDGGYIVAGFTYSNDGNVSGNHDSTDYWIVKLTDSGIIQWQKCLGGTSYDFAKSIQQTTEGEYIVAGYSSSNDGDVSGNHGSDDYWIVKLSSCSSNFSLAADSSQLHHYIAVNLASGKPPISYDWIWGDGAHDTIPYPSHTYATAGFYNICLTITDSTGCTSTFCDSAFHALRTTDYMVYINVVAPTTVGIKEVAIQTPQAIIYPNPLTSSSILQLNTQLIPNESGAEVVIYDVLGKEMMRKKMDGDKMEIERGSLVSGIYFVRVRDEERQWTQKLIIE